MAEEKAKEMVLKMIDEKISVDTISKCTGFSKKEIKSIKANNPY